MFNKISIKILKIKDKRNNSVCNLNLSLLLDVDNLYTLDVTKYLSNRCYTLFVYEVCEYVMM